ncbi:MAG: hypothetical protein KA004_11795, partial [Verrucomicrobiales bacterium]|nr:hypothetical protein [Verrucomicrobiales bacterium]
MTARRAIAAAAALGGRVGSRGARRPGSARRTRGASLGQAAGQPAGLTIGPQCAAERDQSRGPQLKGPGPDPAPSAIGAISARAAGATISAATARATCIHLGKEAGKKIQPGRSAAPAAAAAGPAAAPATGPTGTSGGSAAAAAQRAIPGGITPAAPAPAVLPVSTVSAIHSEQTIGTILA